MGSSTDGPLAARGADEASTDEPASEDGVKGFFGKLLSAFTQPSDAEPRAMDTKARAEPQGLHALRRMRVDDVAVPKTDIVAVPIDIGKDELVAVFRSCGFSRLPVYQGTLDHPQGLVLLKDLALQHGFGAGGRFSLKRLLRPILYAPPSMATGVLLQKMQKGRIHMALVIDEYGGVDGLVTIEDLIETVIGEIEDEHDEIEHALWKEEMPGVILAQSAAPLEEIEAALGLALRTGDEEIDTLGGLVFQRSGHVPARGEVIVHESGVTFEILDADPRRIKKLRVRRAAPDTGTA